MSESGEEPTTRQRIADALRSEPHDATALSATLGVPRSAVYRHVEHVARSVDGSDGDGGDGEQFLVAPPECRECGFDRFDDPLNDPSRCPECRSERIAEPRFVIE